MAIDDPLDKKIDALAEDTRVSVPGEVTKAAIKAAIKQALAQLPYAGEAISSLIDGLIQARTLERFSELIRDMKARLDEVERDGIDRHFFSTEEFQTLLVVVLEQLQSTHDKTKLQMLAAGLANSATTKFRAEERKELFLRILRDLAPQHVQVLQSLAKPGPGAAQAPAGPFPHHSRAIRNPADEELAVLQQLAAHGLVKEQLHPAPFRKNPRFANRWSESEAISAVEQYLRTPPERSFQLSEFGAAFLRFLRAHATGESHQ